MIYHLYSYHNAPINPNPPLIKEIPSFQSRVQCNQITKNSVSASGNPKGNILRLGMYSAEFYRLAKWVKRFRQMAFYWIRLSIPCVSPGMFWKSDNGEIKKQVI